MSEENFFDLTASVNVSRALWSYITRSSVKGVFVIFRVLAELYSL